MNPMFYFFLVLTAVLATTSNANGPILDTDGDTIVDRRSYYVLPVHYGVSEAGGLTVYPRGDNECPRYVGVERMWKGIPLRFSNWRSRVGFVPESENLNIEMNIKEVINSTYWWLGSPEGDGTRFIKACTQPDSRSFFQIKKFHQLLSGYKFAYCPN